MRRGRPEAGQGDERLLQCWRDLTVALAKDTGEVLVGLVVCTPERGVTVIPLPGLERFVVGKLARTDWATVQVLIGEHVP